MIGPRARQALPSRGAQRETRNPGGLLEDTHDRGATRHGTRPRRTGRGVFASKASRAVRRPGKRDAHAPAGRTVGILCRIANGINVGVRRAHKIVGGNPAARADLRPASTASFTFGRTPRPSRTMSAGRRVPSVSRTAVAAPSCSSIARSRGQAPTAPRRPQAHGGVAQPSRGRGAAAPGAATRRARPPNRGGGTARRLRGR